jgi:hypothetical protein
LSPKRLELGDPMLNSSTLLVSEREQLWAKFGTRRDIESTGELSATAAVAALMNALA